MSACLPLLLSLPLSFILEIFVPLICAFLGPELGLVIGLRNNQILVMFVRSRRDARFVGFLLPKTKSFLSSLWVVRSDPTALTQNDITRCALKHVKGQFMFPSNLAFIE
jgi:hypothetical protein